MSLRDFTFVDAYASVWGSDASGGTTEMVTCKVRRSGEAEGTDGDEVELFEHACLQHRPDDPSEDGVCQLLVAQVGGTPIAIASRDLRAAKKGPALDKGAACFGAPTGAFWVTSKKDGGGLLFQGPDGDSGISFEKDGRIILFTPWGSYAFGAFGVKFCNKTGEALALGETFFNVVAQVCALQGGAVALGVGASTPLAPSSVVGTAGGGFCAPKPILNIFVP